MKTPSANYKWLVVAMLWWIAFFNYADRQSIFSVFPLLSHEFNLDDVQLGLLGSSFAAIYGITAPLAGYIVDRLRRKTAILGGLTAWSLICMATAISRSFAHLLFFRAAEGLGETFYFPASMSMVSDYHSRSTRSRAMGFHQTSVYVGTIAGGFFAGLIGQRYGWRWSFVVFGGAGLLLGLVLNQWLIEPQRGEADKAEAVDADSPAAQQPRPVSAPISTSSVSLASFLRLIVARPSIGLCMLAFLCQNFTNMVLFTWMPTLIYREFHMGLAMAGLTATVYVQTASMIGSPCGGWLADVLRRRVPGGRMLVQAFAAGLQVPFVIGVALTHSPAVLVIGLSLWGILKGFYDANIFASIFDVIPPGARGTATGFTNMVAWLGGAGTAPVVIGLLAQRFGLSRSVAFSSASYALACVLLFTAALVFARRDTHAMELEFTAVAADRI